MIYNRATRKNITETAPNNNAVDILTPLILDTSLSALNFILSTTESADTVIFNFNVLSYFLMSLTEGTDSVSFETDNIVSTSLSKTEPSDTADIDTQLLINFTFEKIENTDVTEITASNSLPRNAELSATEQSDRSIIAIFHEQQPAVRRSQGETYSRFVGQAMRKISLNLTENSDGVNITAISETDTIISSSEYTDFSGFKIGLTDSAMIRISESTDSIQNDETGFKSYMRHKKFKHEQDAIIKLLLSA